MHKIDNFLIEDNILIRRYKVLGIYVSLRIFKIKFWSLQEY